MAGFAFLGGHREHIRIATEKISESEEGVTKSSSVRFEGSDNQAERSLWVALKLRQRQKVVGLTVDGVNWIDAKSSPDRRGVAQFSEAMPPDPGSKWAVYAVGKEHKPKNLGKPDGFKTTLTLNRVHARYPDAQTITIGVCYAPAEGATLTAGAVVVGYSVVQAKPPKGRAGTAGKAKT